MKSTLNGPSPAGNAMESFKDARGGMRYEKRADGRTAIYGPGNKFLGYQSEVDEAGAKPGVAVDSAVKPPIYSGAATAAPVSEMPADTDNSPEARAKRVAASKADGSFAQKRKDFNAQNVGRAGMDEFGTIRQASATAPTPRQPAGLTAQEISKGASMGPGTGPKGTASFTARDGRTINLAGNEVGNAEVIAQKLKPEATDESRFQSAYAAHLQAPTAATGAAMVEAGKKRAPGLPGYEAPSAGETNFQKAKTNFQSNRTPESAMMMLDAASSRPAGKAGSTLTYQASLSDPKKKKFGMRGLKSRGRLASMA